MALTYIEDLAKEQPSLSDLLVKCGELYRAKLVHQLTDTIEEVLTRVETLNSSEPSKIAIDWRPFSERFLADVSEKMNLIRYAQIAVRMSNLLYDTHIIKSTTCSTSASASGAAATGSAGARDELSQNIDFVESFIGRVVRMKSTLKGVSPLICDNARLMLLCQVVHFNIIRAGRACAAARDADGDVSMSKSEFFVF